MLRMRRQYPRRGAAAGPDPATAAASSPPASPPCPGHVSRVTCDVTCNMCHVSRVMSRVVHRLHVTHVTCVTCDMCHVWCTGLTRLSWCSSPSATSGSCTVSCSLAARWWTPRLAASTPAGGDYPLHLHMVQYPHHIHRWHGEVVIHSYKPRDDAEVCVVCREAVSVACYECPGYAAGAGVAGHGAESGAHPPRERAAVHGGSRGPAQVRHRDLPGQGD